MPYSSWIKLRAAVSAVSDSVLLSVRMYVMWPASYRSCAARMVRAEVLGARHRDWVDAARAVGATDARILWRHVVPNAVGPAIVATTLGVGNAILLESGLSFLGLGIQPPAPSWGNMIAGGRDLIVAAPWVAIAPGLALVVTVLACTLLGDSLRDRVAGEAGTTLRERA